MTCGRFCLLCLCGFLAVLPNTAQAVGAFWYPPGELASALGSPWFQHEAELFLNASILSYTATWGSYYEPASANRTINSDWQRSALESNPQLGGMRALTFVSASTQRVIVAFRGTDVGPDAPSSHADLCADAILWSGAPRAELPPYCANYTNATLDYFSRALDFVSSVAQEYEGFSIMLTGHSLGAGLAAMVTAAESCLAFPPYTTLAGAVVVSAPGYIRPLLNRTNVTVGQLSPDRFFMLADAYDPIFVNANASFAEGSVGSVCIYHDGVESLQCQRCDAHPQQMNASSVDCMICMEERHRLSHYVRLIRRGASQGLQCGNARHPCRPPSVEQCSSLQADGCSTWS